MTYALRLLKNPLELKQTRDKNMTLLPGGARSSAIYTLVLGLVVSLSVLAEIPATSLVHEGADKRDRALIDALHAFLPAYLKALDAPGVNIALSRRGEVVWEGAYGYADVAAKVPTSPDTVFRSGSMGKVYTGVAIMQLVERGVISLDDPINKHLPFEVKNPLGGGEITVFNLMVHTAGLAGDAAGSVFGDTRSLEETLREKYSRETQPMAGGLPTWTKPVGELRQYSNIGIATLGLIVARANPDKLNFSEFVERNIMQPLKMEYTQYPPAQSKAHVRPDIWERMSVGYNSQGDVWLPTPLVYFENYPAGGFVSVPRDHVRLFLALSNGGELDGARILKQESVDAMLTPQLEGELVHGTPRPGERQGLVWWLRDWDGPTKAFHHGGGHMYGWRTMGIAWPEFDTALVVAFNEWSALNAKNYTRPVEDFVESWLQSERPPRPELPQDIKNLAWKTSYLRGLLFVESYRLSLGIPQQLDLDDMKRLAGQAVAQTWQGDRPLWNKQAFLQGIEDMNGVEVSIQAVQDYARSGMQLSLEEAKRLYPHISSGAMRFGTLGGLLLAE